MALWTTSYPIDTGDRDPSFMWADTDPSSAGTDAAHGDIFSQFLDFEGGVTSGEAHLGHTAVVDPLFLDPLAQHPPAHDGSASSGVSTADDFDFLSSSSHIDPPMSAASYEIDPSALTLFGEKNVAADAQQPPFFSDTEIEKLEALSVHSPVKLASEPPSPTLAPATITAPKTRKATGTATRKSKKIVDALSSTIRKATMRKTRKGAAQDVAAAAAAEGPDRPASPVNDAPLKPAKQRGAAGRRVQTQHQVPRMPDSPPLHVDTANFIHGQPEDPFASDTSPTHGAVPMRYYSQGGLGTPMDSPTRKSETDLSVNHQAQQQQQQQQHQLFAAFLQWQQENGISPSVEASQQWEYFAQHAQSNNPAWANANLAMHTQHGQLPYEYTQQMQDASGLMIHMPQPRPPVVNDLSLSAQTYLPPPAPQERASRPPKAPSAGARHRTVSSSPMRKQRGPSASPTSGSGAGSGVAASNQRQSRHSSGGSVSSVRSASGRLPGSMPGTPCSVRKRRSVTGTTLNTSAIDDSGPVAAPAAPSGGFQIGFVNFTPNDGSALMTGVAPSGSSKTKARREKEAQDKRRRLSEAAMKAVAAAGGDIEKLREQGFEF
ncbi:Putative WetA [[Torrubiella] hemipterigena]|uniref:Putative WetA n=1 Tax=[Torrubiella] hemipterigena TaxID=1531966 RepID=A0A0A1TAX5_9HYPO|nr:Putative WetA [[Torrubiella] hemipterigena]